MDASIPPTALPDDLQCGGGGFTRAERATSHAGRRLGNHVHLVRGSVSIMAATMLASGTGWFFWVVATHRWPTIQIGQATSLVAALSSIALIAGQPIATTMLVRLPRSASRSSLLGAGVVSAVAIALVESAIAIFVLPPSVGVIRTIGLAVLFTVGASAAAAGIVLDASSIAIRKPGLMVARNAMHGAGKLVLLGALAIPAGLVTGPYAVVGVWAVLSVVSSLWAWARCAPLVAEENSTPRASRVAGFHELRSGFGLQVVGTLGGSLPPQLLPILVVGVLGGVEAGWFSITWLVGGLCFMISPAVSQALLAEGSYQPAELDSKTYAAAALSSGLLLGPIVVYVTAGHFVLGLFGATYAAHGTTLLVILAISAVPDLITNVAVARYRVQGRLMAAAVVNTVIAAIAIGGTALALHRHGINGAGWAWALAETAGCLVLLVLVLLDQRTPARFPATKAPT